MEGQILSSITTRIKTVLEDTFMIKHLRQILSSITTRIKTFMRTSYEVVQLNVRYYLPLQQGLRRCSISLNSGLSTVRYYLPLQQGLRRKLPAYFICLFVFVRYYLPLQQGLRQPFILNLCLFFICQILSSITTRIKTTLLLLLMNACFSSDTIFHYNKD